MPRAAAPPERPKSHGSGTAITAQQKQVYWERRDAGISMRSSCAAANFSLATAQRIEKMERSFHKESMAIARAPDAPPPKNVHDLSDEAKKALTTFAYFQRRYFGRIPIPWQVEAAERMIDLLNSEADEYIVVNCPPGSGKSTLFTMDLAAWATVRDRAIRGQIGSFTLSQAKKYTLRLRRAFETTIPFKAEMRLVKLGLAVDPESTLSLDYGRFKPLDRELWTSDQFIVMQESGVAISEKEPTWSAFGKDSAFLGGRYDLVIWDDLVDPKFQRSPESRDELKMWYGDIAETRLEPGGLLILQGQRIGADDLYRHALDQTLPEYDDEGEEVEGSDAKKYHHIVYKAHYEEKCKGAEGHKLSSPPFPQGCLLYPRRLDWKKISTWMANRNDRFRVLYQQEDTAPETVLVNPDWVWGHRGFPGCVDEDRDRLEIPEGLNQCLSVVTCDPSPTKNWAIIWWLVEPISQMRYMIDLYSGRLEAPQLLDFNSGENRFDGLMDDWQRRSVQLGAPITHWVVEVNAAQRFLLQYDHFKRWQELTGIEVIPHTTGKNKADPEYGVECIAPHFRYGRYRLPGRGEGRTRSLRLISEVTTYPTTRTDDTVMATWFLEWNLPNLSTRSTKQRGAWRPSWLKTL